MKLSQVLGGCCNAVHGKEFPMNSIVMDLENVTFVCTDFRQSRKKPLQVYCYILAEKKWVITFLKGNYKNIMCDYYRKCERKHNIRKGNYRQMMQHDRKKKRGSGSKESHKYATTDYECTKNPMHDFRKSYYI